MLWAEFDELWWMTQSSPISTGVAARLLPTPSTLTSGFATVDATSFATASITPAANQPIYAFYASSSAATTGEPTATGNGLTWVRVVTRLIGANNRRLTLFRAAGAAPSAGAVTFDSGVQTQTTGVWWVGQFAQADTSGTNGSGATVQSNSASFATSTGGNLTLAAFEHVNNVHLAGVMSRNTGNSITPDPQFAELVEVITGSEFVNLSIQWARGENTIDPTWTNDTAIIASVEVKAG
jgi:hypothetical protein